MPPARPPNGPAGTPASSSWRPTPPRGPTSASAPERRPSTLRPLGHVDVNITALFFVFFASHNPAFVWRGASLSRVPASPPQPHATRRRTFLAVAACPLLGPRLDIPPSFLTPTCNPRVAHLLPPASSNAASHLETCMPARKALSSATPVLILARLLVCAHTRLAAAFALLGACAPRDGGGVASRFETGRR